MRVLFLAAIAVSHGEPAEAELPDTGNAFRGAINLIDGQVYRHHPVMLTVKAEPYPMQPEYLVELNGLRVPAGWDCNIFNKNNRAWGLYWYFNDIPSRWHACWRHHTAIKSGLQTEVSGWRAFFG